MRERSFGISRSAVRGIALFNSAYKRCDASAASRSRIESRIAGRNRRHRGEALR